MDANDHKELLRQYPELSSEQIKGYLEGTLTPAEQRVVESAMIDNPLSSEAIDGFEASGMSAAHYADALSKLNSEIDVIASSRHGRKRIEWVRYAAAASVILLLGAGAWMLNNMQNKRLEDTFTKNYEPFKLEDTIRKKTDLSDDAEVVVQPEEVTAEQSADSEGGFSSSGGSSVTPELEVSRTPDIVSEPALVVETEPNSPAEGAREYDLEEDADFDEDAAVAIGEVGGTDQPTEQAEEEFVLEEAIFQTYEDSRNDVSMDDSESAAIEQKEEAFQNDNGQTKSIPSAPAQTAVPDREKYATYESLSSQNELVSETEQGIIKGRITEAETGEALLGANVYDASTGRGTTSDPEGNFTLELEPGSHELNIAYIGFADTVLNIEVEAGKVYEQDLSLNTNDLALQNVTIQSDQNTAKDKRSRDGKSNRKSAATDASVDETQTSPVQQMEQARLLYGQGAYLESIPLFEYVLNMQPSNAEALLLCANAYLSTGDPEKAVTKCESLLELPRGPFHEAGSWYLALAWLELGKEKKAIEMLEPIASGGGIYAEDAADILNELK